jgi:predicted nucleic acid-binding protein
MPRFVVADASPLIGLATAGVLVWLRELFGTVMITRLVKDEVAGRGARPGAKELDTAMRAGWIRVAPTPPETWGFEQIDSGEASTIALAAKHEDALVLMDDALARASAAELGLEVIDLGAVLLLAKEARLVGAIKPVLGRLARAGFTIPERRRSALLHEAGEMPGRQRR